MLLNEERTAVLRIMENVCHEWQECLTTQEVRTDINKIRTLLAMQNLVGCSVTSAEVHQWAPSFVAMFGEVMMRNVTEKLHGNPESSASTRGCQATA